MATQMAAIIVVFALLGIWLDGHFATDKAYFTAALTVLGVILSVYFMIKDLLK